MNKQKSCKKSSKKRNRQSPLLCIFYAEFDNTIGPKICFQFPVGFMDKCIIQHQASSHEEANDDSEDKCSCNNSIFNAVSDICIAGPELADTILCVFWYNIGHKKSFSV